MSKQEDFHRPEKPLGKMRGKLITNLEYQRDPK